MYPYICNLHMYVQYIHQNRGQREINILLLPNNNYLRIHMYIHSYTNRIIYVCIIIKSRTKSRQQDLGRVHASSCRKKKKKKTGQQGKAFFFLSFFLSQASSKRLGTLCEEEKKKKSLGFSYLSAIGTRKKEKRFFYLS